MPAAGRGEAVTGKRRDPSRRGAAGLGLHRPQPGERRPLLRWGGCWARRAPAGSPGTSPSPPVLGTVEGAA